VNVAGITVELSSRISLCMFPLGLLAGLWFMRIADTPRRMAYFVGGAALMVAGYVTPAVLGFSLATLVAANALGWIGGAFAFEGIMKVWSQESFPTMLRSSAQGAIIAFARVVAAVLALVTPALLDAGARTLYIVLASVVGVGLAIGWWGFHKNQRTEFAVERAVDAGDEKVPDYVPS